MTSFRKAPIPCLRLSFHSSKGGEDLAVLNDSIIGEVFQIRVWNGQLIIVERDYYTVAEMMQEASADWTETSYYRWTGSEYTPEEN